MQVSETPDPINDGQPTPQPANPLAALEAPTPTPDSPSQNVAPPATETDEDASLPEKFRGKTRAEIAKSVQHLESTLGRQSNELGAMRKKLDEVIAREVTPAAPQQASNDDDTSFFVDPKTSVLRTVDAHPAIVEARRVAQELRAEKALIALKQAHPDAATVVSDQGFQDWTGQSPIRQQLYQQAAQGDANAAIELVGTYKLARNARLAAAGDVPRPKPLTTGSGPGTPIQSAPVESGGPLISRAKLAHLASTNPAEYQRLGPEIRKAYLEGRVVG